MLRMGVDEAGRGCVLGSLVVGVFLTRADDAALREAGAQDSKALSAARREQARERLLALGAGEAHEIEVSAINTGNLNELEEEAIAALIARHRPDTVHIDALGHPRTLPATRERLLQRLAGHGLAPQITIEPKADATWPTVGAASIVAKVHRDQQLHALEATWGPLGSGYPSDPVTRAWLTERLRSGQPWPPFVRTRWATLDRIAQGELFEVGR